jgi:hypothetical protein
MTLSGNGNRLFTNLNYQAGGFTPFASQPGFGSVPMIDLFSDDSKPDLYIGSQKAQGGLTSWIKKPGLLGLGDDSLYSDVGVNPSYTGTQLSTDPVTSIQNVLFGGSPTGIILLAVGGLFAWAILGGKR